MGSVILDYLIELEITSVADAPGVAHLDFRVAK